MPKRLSILPVLAVFSLLSAPVAAQDAIDPKTVVATVNGEQITLGHLAIARAGLPEQYQQIPAETLFDGLLEQLIQQSALAQSLDGAPSAQVQLSLENERRSLFAADAMQRVLEGAISDADIKAAYDAQYSTGSDEQEFDAAHILVETEEEARQIKADLDAGADFADTAREKSTGPSGPRGGALGWFGAGMMVPAFETAVTTLEPGEVSDPVQTQFGWHLVKLNGTRIKEAPTLESVRAQIVSELQTKVIEDHVDAVTAAATIERSDMGDADAGKMLDLSILGN